MRAVILLTCVAGVVGSATTGLGSNWLRGAVTGWALVIHLLFAPLVLAGFAAAALMWGRAHRFDSERCGGCGALGVARKTCFWLAVACAGGVSATFVAAAAPLFAYSGQHQLMEWHERSGVGLLASGAAYVWFAARRPRGGVGKHAA